MWTKIRDNKTTLDGKALAPYAPIIRKQLKRNRQSAFAQQQALRLGLLAGQVLEQSDNPAKTYPQTATPKGWSFNYSAYMNGSVLRERTLGPDIIPAIRGSVDARLTTFILTPHYICCTAYRIDMKNVYSEKSEIGGTCRLSTKIKAQ